MNIGNIKYNSNYNEGVTYIIFGILTTLLNFLLYFILTETTGIGAVTSNIIATAASIIFAYITNKIFVFNSKTNSIKETFVELIKFIFARILTGILDTIMIYVGVDVLKANNFLVKTVACIIVIVLNYILSKIIIFSKH